MSKLILTHPVQFSLVLLLCAGSFSASAQKRTARVQRAVANKASERLSSSDFITAPILGFVQIPGTSGIRAIVGVPGASSFSDLVVLPDSVTSVYLAPYQRYALVETGGSASIAVMAFNGLSAKSVTGIDGAITSADLVAFSPKGQAAALFSQGAGRLQVLTGLPDNPQVAQDLRTDALPPDIRLLVVSDDGALVLAGTNENELLALAAGAAPSRVYSSADLTAVALLPNSGNAVIADRAAGQLSMLQIKNGAVVSFPIATGLAGLDAGLSLQSSSDGQRLFVSNPATKQVWSFDLGTLQLASFDMPDAPLFMQALRNQNTFLLSAQPEQPAWILDANTATLRPYFVSKLALPVTDEGVTQGRIQ